MATTRQPRVGAGGERASGQRPVGRARPASGPPDRRPASDWRATVATAAAINLVAGVWLVISPWVLGYTGADATWNPVVFGAIVVLLALVRMAGGARESIIGYLNAAIGLWLFASAFWLADSAQAFWNVLLVGALVFFVGLAGGVAADDANAGRA